MPEHVVPGVFVEETGTGPKPIAGVDTSTAAFLGPTERGPEAPQLIASWAEFTERFGGHLATETTFMTRAVEGFFLNGGRRCWIARALVPGEYARGFESLERIDASLMVAPDDVRVPGLADQLIDSCEKLSRFAIVNSPRELPANPRAIRDTRFAAEYFPWLQLADGSIVPPAGHVAGIYVRTDIEQGFHRAPANAVVVGAASLDRLLSAHDQDQFNLVGINTIREFIGRGILAWGARTMSSDPRWKYVNVQRLFSFIEQSLSKGTQWAVFEPSDDSLWSRVRLSVSGFLVNLWRNGVLTGQTTNEAFFVKCDRSTMTDEDIANGRLILEIGIAPVRPAEFILFRVVHQTGS